MILIRLWYLWHKKLYLRIILDPILRLYNRSLPSSNMFITLAPTFSFSARMVSRYFLTIALLVVAQICLAQTAKLSEDPTQFVADVQKMMSLSDSPGSPIAVKNLEAAWIDTRLNASHQKSVIAIARRMAAKGFKASPQFEQFFNSIYAGLNGQYAAPETLEGYFATASQVVEKYDSKNMLKFFESARTIFEKRILYNTNYNRLYAFDGPFSFRFSDATSEILKTIESAKTKANDDGWGSALNDTTVSNSPIFYEKKKIPNLSGAIIEFKNANLVFVTYNDSVTLANTTGKVAIKEGLWTGVGGKFTWEVAGDPSIYVNIGPYSFNINTPKLTADDAKLHYDSKLTQPIDGLFEFESKRRDKNQKSSYPRFFSYKNDASVRNLSKNILYKGGLSMNGLQILGTSLSNEPSSITVMKAGKVAFKATSRRFDLKDTLITSPLAHFVTYIGANDSLYHPGVRLTYNENEGMVKCARVSNAQYQYTPFSDTYHQMYIYSEMLRWNFKRNQIEFYVVSGRTEVPIVLESFNFFKPERYRAISEELTFHPLSMAANYIAKQKKSQFTVYDLADYYKKDAQVLRGAYNQMIREGYIEQDPNTELMTLSRKGLLYVLSYNKQSDYDNLRISALYPASEKTANASIDLNDNAMTIRGVDQFTISDSLKIFAYPSDKQVRMIKNRDFMINGQLKSANFKFNGRDLVFNYDKFFVDLNKIDKITFIPKAVYDKGGTTEIGDDIVYEKSGRIYLNDTKNKSGRLKNSVFPRLTVPEGMTVYFDQPDRGQLIYNRKVFFKIPSIDYDSLGLQDIVFIGSFTSDGIFPTFPAELRSMDDNSLGFIYKPPTNGYKVYGTNTNVKFSKEIVMDKKGLRSVGEISHLSARIPTQQMLFMTDSLLASGAEAEIKEATIGKAYFPKVDLRNFTLRWMPKQDSMVLTTQGNFFNFYNGSTKLEGRIVLRSMGLFGKGFLKRDDSELTSQDIKFNKEGFLAGDAQYKILSAQNNIRPVFLGKNVDIDFSIVKGLSNISTKNSTDVISSFEFPFAAYRTSINKAQWNINAKTIAMKGDVKTSTFTATAPEQETLTFNGSAALYEIEKMTLNISGVPHIHSADARILPDKGLVVVRRNGDMMPFTNARLVVDTLNEYHRLRNANIQIVSRSKYTGDANYLYTTTLKDTVTIRMTNFEMRPGVAYVSSVPVPIKDAKGKQIKQPTRSIFTVARATVAETENFIMTPRMQYKGGLTLLAPEPNLQYEGFVKPQIKKRIDLVPTWVPFKELPSRDIALKITPTLKNEADQPVSIGLHYRTGSTELYATFLSPKELRTDQTLFSTTGLLSYDEKAKIFKVVPEPKSTDELIDESMGYTLEDTKGKISYQGRLNLINEKAKEGEEMFLSAGSAQINLDSLQHRFNALLALNFPANPQVLGKLAESIVQSNLDEQIGDAAEPDWVRLGAKLTSLIGKKASDSYINRATVNHRSLSDASPKMAATVVLSNVNLRWSSQQNAFYSTGKIGVSNLGSTDINAQMEGMVEIRKGNRGDEISIYLESSPETWYFFDWQQGKLSFVSSIPEVNDLLKGKKGDKAKEPIINEITENDRDQFFNRFSTLFRPKKAKPTTTKKGQPILAKPTLPNNSKPVLNNSKVLDTDIAEAEEPQEKPTNSPKVAGAKDSKTAVKDPKATTKDPKADPKTAAKTPAANTKVAQTPAKLPVKKDKKEEEKEGF
jgi:hypothetical protein